MTPGQQAQERELIALKEAMQRIREISAEYIAAEVIAKARKPHDEWMGWPVLGGGAK